MLDFAVISFFVSSLQYNSSGKSPSHHRISVILSAPKYQPPEGRMKGERSTPWRPGEEYSLPIKFNARMLKPKQVK